MAEHFLGHFCRRYDRSSKSLDTTAMHVLAAVRWPGNVRQLRNVMERLVVTTPSDLIEAKDLPDDLVHVASSANAPVMTLAEATEASEKDAIKSALAACDCHREKTAKVLGISVRSLHYKMSRYGLH